jgi:dGTPase
MKNQFYNAFDLERFDHKPSPQDDYRNAFQIERDRVIFSYPFRKLQSKTQVFQSGEYDFYRTRLTHSIEVAKICRSICEFLKTRSPLLSQDFFIDPDLTEAIGLAHDLGHPPFGHIGERRLNHITQTHGGFEGNAQTLRILTELIYQRPQKKKGIAPTRAFLDGVMKYKALHSECIQKDPAGKPIYPENHFIYDHQSIHRERIFGQNHLPAALTSPAELNQFKSIECQIMDWADDTAYSLNDIVDGVHARYLSVGSISEWASSQKLREDEAQLIDQLCKVIREDRYEAYFGWRVGQFVTDCSLQPRQGFLSPQTHRHAFDLVVAPERITESRLYKKIAYELIFQSPQLQQIEFKGGFILDRLYAALSESCLEPESPRALKLLPKNEQALLAATSDPLMRHRIICDFIAGLTDDLAIRTYKRLYNPEFGSIAELL